MNCELSVDVINKSLVVFLIGRRSRDVIGPLSVIKPCRCNNAILAMLQQIFPGICRGVTLGNVACNLSHNGATKLWDKLQQKSPGVAAP